MSNEKQSAIHYEANTLTPAELCEMRAVPQWAASKEAEVAQAQAARALKHTLYSIAARDENQRIVGMARLIGDGAMRWVVEDVVVRDEYRGMGIGRELIQRLLDYIESQRLPGEVVGVDLMAAKGKEPFYAHFGFAIRPPAEGNNGNGYGMSLLLGEEDK